MHLVIILNVLKIKVVCVTVLRVYGKYKRVFITYKARSPKWKNLTVEKSTCTVSTVKCSLTGDFHWVDMAITRVHPSSFQLISTIATPHTKTISIAILLMLKYEISSEEFTDLCKDMDKLFHAEIEIEFKMHGLSRSRKGDR